MHDIYNNISQVGIAEIEELTKAVLKRYSELFPDWEISTISVHKHTDHNTQIDSIIDALRSMKAQ